MVDANAWKSKKEVARVLLQTETVSTQSGAQVIVKLSVTSAVQLYAGAPLKEKTALASLAPEAAVLNDKQPPATEYPGTPGESVAANWPTPFKKPSDEFLPVFTSNDDGELSRDGFFQLGSLEEKDLFTMRRESSYHRFESSLEKMAFRTEADYWRYHDAPERQSKIPSASPHPLEVKEQRGDKSMSAAPEPAGVVPVLNQFTLLSNHVEEPDTPPVRTTVENAKESMDADKIAALAIKKTPKKKAIKGTKKDTAEAKLEEPLILRPQDANRPFKRGTS